MPLWLHPGQLSLDAPALAVGWLHVFAESWRLYLPWPAYVSLGLAAWILCVGDRLIDVSMAGSAGLPLEARQEFHRRHHRILRLAMMAASVAALLIVVLHMPKAIYGNLLVAGVLVGGYFGLTLLSPSDPPEAPILKNVMGGIAFAFGIAMIAHSYRFEYGLFDLVSARDFLCFTVLCILHLCALDLWKHSSRSADVEIKARDELTLTLPLALLALATLAFAVQDSFSRPFFYAILTGAALLHLLNRRRGHYSPDALRSLAAATLFAPVPVFFVLQGA